MGKGVRGSSEDPGQVYLLSMCAYLPWGLICSQVWKAEVDISTLMRFGSWFSMFCHWVDTTKSATASHRKYVLNEEPARNRFTSLGLRRKLLNETGTLFNLSVTDRKTFSSRQQGSVIPAES